MKTINKQKMTLQDMYEVLIDGKEIKLDESVLKN
tara:strand:- start:298 stop:399 length:102 start_codon:yes stop_codon:yes gene_type:complete